MFKSGVACLSAFPVVHGSLGSTDLSCSLVPSTSVVHQSLCLPNTYFLSFSDYFDPQNHVVYRYSIRLSLVILSIPVRITGRL